jgi:hypothetical protein
VPGPLQHAAPLRLEREDVTRSREVARPGVRIDEHPHRVGPIGGGDAGRDAPGGVDRDGEGGPQRGRVARHHGLQVEFGEAFTRGGQADQAPAVLGQEVDGPGRDLLRGHHEVPLVLAILVVDDDDDLALLQGRHGGLNAVQRGLFGHGFLLFVRWAQRRRPGPAHRVSMSSHRPGRGG